MRFFRYPLPRVLAVTVALFAALSFALPALNALAVPPDNGPIQGTGTAVQDPPGSCPGRPDTIAFPATVQIQGGVLHITDPGGETSGTINADGTADLNGQGESYALLSSQGTTLNLREINGGCSFLTTIVLQRVLYQVPTEPPSTQVSETAAQPTASGTPGVVAVPETSGGRSLWWFWGGGIVVAVVLAGGGWWFYMRQPVTITDVAPDCPEERRRVQQALDKLQAMADYPELRGALGSETPSWLDASKELHEAVRALAKCLGVDSVTEYTQDLLKRFGFPPIPGGDPPKPGPGFDPDAVPPTEGSGDEGDDRQEIG